MWHEKRFMIIRRKRLHFYSFEKNHEEFEKSFFKWKFDDEKMAKPEITGTDYFNQTSDYLKWRILRLVKKIRNNEFKFTFTLD